MKQRIRIKTVVLAGILALLTGCLHQVDVQQGNAINAHAMSTLHQGMTEPQVVQHLGEPMLKNIFKADRLIYVYTIKGTNGSIQKKQLQIYFQNGRVTRYVYEQPRN